MARRRERRKAPRVEWHTPARIRLPAGSVPCVVRNLSNTGARITAPRIQSLPDEFVLELSGTRDRACRVVWRTKTELGVAFAAVTGNMPKPRPARSQVVVATA